ncbi:MAG TPA: alpha/beta fold hydrolase [Ramlibacter sp.]|jgi:triacylglycerol esterase/lipase EstA (alpha/beta hydrolase family)|nr:alpha/beta fold hydrolase [Ramlibacter sp.]
MPQHSTLARMLQVSTLFQLSLALAWLAWRWPHSIAQAAFGAALVLSVAPVILAIELLIVSRINRSQPGVPAPRPAQLLHAWGSESVHFFRTFCWRQPFRWRAEPDFLEGCRGRTGVLLVHGFMCNRGFWNAWMRVLRARGIPHVAVNLEPVYGSIDAYGPIVDAGVRRLHEATGCAPVLVGHSMGGLAARAWWRASGNAASVAALVTIGSPHAGTWLARWSSRTNGRQMRLQSEWLRAIAAHEEARPLPPATCWFSNCDNVVFPAPTATLGGAQNRFVAGQAHVALAFHPEVLAETLALVARIDGARQGESVTGTAAENV